MHLGVRVKFQVSKRSRSRDIVSYVCLKFLVCNLCGRSECILGVVEADSLVDVFGGKFDQKGRKKE